MKISFLDFFFPTLTNIRFSKNSTRFMWVYLAINLLIWIKYFIYIYIYIYILKNQNIALILATNYSRESVSLKEIKNTERNPIFPWKVMKKRGLEGPKRWMQIFFLGHNEWKSYSRRVYLLSVFYFFLVFMGLLSFFLLLLLLVFLGQDGFTFSEVGNMLRIIVLVCHKYRPYLIQVRAESVKLWIENIKGPNHFLFSIIIGLWTKFDHTKHD